MARLDLSGLEGPALLPGEPARAPLSSFEEDPEQPRTEIEGSGFEELVEDIRQRGILQPIVVVKTKTGMLRIRFGARRYRAAKKLDLGSVPYVLSTDARQWDEYAQVSENERRQGLQPHELAAFMVRRLAAGDSKALLADKLGVDPSVITHHLNLVDGPAFVLELYAKGKCRSPKYLYTLSRLHAKNPALVEARAAEATEISSAFFSALSLELEAGEAAHRHLKDGAGEGASRATPSTTSPAVEGLDATAIAAAKGLVPKGDTKERAVTRIKRPLLLGRYMGREVRVLVDRQPSAAGLIFIQYRGDGVHDEVAADELSLFWLGETNKGAETKSA